MRLSRSSGKDFILGKDPRQRVRMKRSMIAAVVYLACLIAQWEFVRLGVVTFRDAQTITVLCVSGVITFLFAIRSGLSTRFADAALTMPQMVFAIVCLAAAYHANPACRSSVTLIVPLVLVFGAFILPARRCVQLGWFAVAVFGMTVCYGIRSDPEVFPPLVEIHGFGFILLVVPAIAHLAGQLSQLRIDQKVQRDQLRDAMERLQRMATHDALTGLPNRRHVDERISDVIVGTRGRNVPLCLAILDLDRFKRINDLYGHAAGDEVLRIFARETSAMLGDGDLLARWGGEEFLLVLPGIDVATARQVVARMRTRLAESARWDASSVPRATFSAGLVVLGPDQTLQQALQLADAALYEAKHLGRDQTIVAATDREVVPMTKQPSSPRRFIEQLSNVF